MYPLNNPTSLNCGKNMLDFIDLYSRTSPVFIISDIFQIVHETGADHSFGTGYEYVHTSASALLTRSSCESKYTPAAAAHSSMRATRASQSISAPSKMLLILSSRTFSRIKVSPISVTCLTHLNEAVLFAIVIALLRFSCVPRCNSDFCSLQEGLRSFLLRKEHYHRKKYMGSRYYCVL